MFNKQHTRCCKNFPHLLEVDNDLIMMMVMNKEDQLATLPHAAIMNKCKKDIFEKKLNKGENLI